MTFTDKGYFPYQKEAIVNTIATSIETLLGRPIDRTLGSSLMMYIRACADLIMDIQQNIADYTHMQNAQEAIGDFIRTIALEAGIEQGGAVRARGTLLISGPAQGSPNGDIPEGSAFYTPTGIKYVTIENATLKQRIPVVHQDDNVDSIPSPYSNVSASKIESVSRYADGTGTYSQGDPGWEATDIDEISWTGSYPDTPATNAVYYVNVIPTEEITVSVSIIADQPGISQNTPKDTITVNSDGIVAVSSLTNPNDIDNGLDEEPLTDLRNRYLATPYRDWSKEKLISEILKIDGIRTAQVREYRGTDQFDPDNWTYIGDTPNVTLEWPNQYAQIYRSGERVLGFSGVTLRVKANDALATGPFRVEFYVWRNDYNTTLENEPIDSYEFNVTNMQQGMAIYEFQNIDVPMVYGGLNRALRYLIVVRSLKGSSGSWLLRINDPAENQTQGYFRAYDSDDQGEVLDYTISDPSTLTPSDGDRYIVPVGAVGDWSGQDDSIATWVTDHWEFETPELGYLVNDLNSDNNLLFDGIWNNIGNNTFLVLDQSFSKSMTFQTHFFGNGYTVYIFPKTGYTFDSLKPLVEEKITQFTPVTVPKYVLQSQSVQINVRSKLSLSIGYELSDIEGDLENAIRSYIESRKDGEKVIYVEIGRIIIATQGVQNYSDLEITRNEDDPLQEWQTNDIYIGPGEVAVLGSPGTSFTV